MNNGTAKRIAVMIRRRLFSLLKYPKFPLDTLEDVFALLCFLFLFFFSQFFTYAEQRILEIARMERQFNQRDRGSGIFIVPGGSVMK